MKHAHTKCAILARQVTRAATAMGFAAETVRSRVSASRYVYVTTSDGEIVKVRCSDHAERHDSDSDLYAWAGECPAQVIAELAARLGAPVPERYRSEAYAHRSAAAKRAAATRQVTRIQDRAAQVAAVWASLGGRGVGIKQAGQAVDRVLPGLGATVRQDIARRIALRSKEAAAVRRVQTLAARGDTATLTRIGAGQMAASIPYGVERLARDALRDLAGAGYDALRPAGTARATWAV